MSAPIEQAVAAFLSVNLTDLVFYPNVIPELVPPGTYAGTYALIDTLPVHLLEKSSAVVRARFQINLFSANYGDVCQGVSDLRTALPSFKSVQVLGAFEDSVGDDYIFADNDSDRGTFMKHMDVIVTYFPNVNTPGP